MMDWKDVPKYGKKKARFITWDEFREASTDVAAKIAYDVNDVKIGLILAAYAALISKELFKDEKEDK